MCCAASRVDGAVQGVREWATVGVMELAHTRRVRPWFQAAALTLGLCAGAARADSIAWVGTDFPPMAMSQGEYARQGYIDRLFLHLQESLPQHALREEIVPWTRAMTMAQRGGPYCLISAFQTPERDAFLRFTAPYGYLLPIGVVIRGNDQDRMSAFVTRSGEFRLAEALRRPEFGMGVASSRSYGPKIDSLLQPLVAAGAKQIHRAYQDESTRFLLSMLESKRFDYMLAYPSEAVYYATSPTSLRFYPIEGNSELLPGRFSCTRSPETDRIFADVSALAPTRKTRAVFLAGYERWLPKYLLASYRQRLAEVPGASP